MAPFPPEPGHYAVPHLGMSPPHESHKVREDVVWEPLTLCKNAPEKGRSCRNCNLLFQRTFVVKNFCFCSTITALQPNQSLLSARCTGNTLYFQLNSFQVSYAASYFLPKATTEITIN